MALPKMSVRILSIGLAAGLAVAGCSSDPSSQAARGAPCSAGVDQWLDTAAQQRVMAPPKGAKAINRDAKALCGGARTAGQAEVVSLSVRFSSDSSDEQVVTGLRANAAVDGWTDAFSEHGTCLMKQLDGVNSYLVIDAGSQANYAVTIGRADPAVCQNTGTNGG